MNVAAGLRRVGERTARFVARQLLFALGLFAFVVVPFGAAFVLAIGTWVAVVLTGHGTDHARQVLAFVFSFPIVLFAFATMCLPGCVLVRTAARWLQRNETPRAMKPIRRLMTWLIE